VPVSAMFSPCCGLRVREDKKKGCSYGVYEQPWIRSGENRAPYLPFLKLL
jgi:hypothetical protein